MVGKKGGCVNMFKMLNFKRNKMLNFKRNKMLNFKRKYTHENIQKK